ncbi:MAG: hypothetical protein H6Q15_574 [Bacteroidetes bacterium]|nr:hypothetical protein [Bacteroidota bacterium]
MAITYKIWKKKFRNSQKEEVEKYFACKMTMNTLSTKQVAERITEVSSLSEGDFLSSLSQISWVLKTFLSLGQNITLDGIGTFSISVTSSPMDSPEDLSKAKIKAKRVVFRQAPELKQILDNLEFKQVNKKRSPNIK